MRHIGDLSRVSARIPADCECVTAKTHLIWSKAPFTSLIFCSVSVDCISRRLVRWVSAHPVPFVQMPTHQEIYDDYQSRNGYVEQWQPNRISSCTPYGDTRKESHRLTTTFPRKPPCHEYHSSSSGSPWRRVYTVPCCMRIAHRYNPWKAKVGAVGASSSE